MALSYKQKRRIYHILSVGKKKGATRAQLLSALATARTEANYGNPKGGHGTSSGWRQQISGAGVKSRNRRNVRKQAGYYFDEAKGLKGTPGQISNAVQRSAHPYKASDPGVNREAREILRAFEQGKLGKVSGKGPRRGGSTRTTRTVTPGVDNSALRQQLKMSYLSQRGRPDALLDLAQGLRESEDVPGRTTTKVVKRKGTRGGKGGKPGKGTTDISRIARKAKNLGLSVGGNQGVTGRPESSGHTQGSYHYKRARKKGWQSALDISGDPKKVAALHRYLRRRYGKDLDELIFNVGGSASRNIKHGKRVGRGFYSGHRDHLHVADVD